MAVQKRRRLWRLGVATLVVWTTLTLMYLFSFDECPPRGVVGVHAGGRMGNMLWEYAATFIVAHRTGLQPFVPYEIRQSLDQIFLNLSIPAKNMRPCASIWNQHLHGDLRDVPNSPSITLKNFVGPWYGGLIQIVFQHQSELRRELRLQPHLVEHARQILLSTKPTPASVFIGVHVRRADYRHHLSVLYNTTMVDVGYYLRAMEYFRTKYKNTIFVIASDDPKWCKHKLVGARSDVFVTEGSKEQDFATLSSCNHSIIDYGTFGEWSSFLAGGETVVYDLTRFQDHSSNLAQIFKHWRVMS